LTYTDSTSAPYCKSIVIPNSIGTTVSTVSEITLVDEQFKHHLYATGILPTVEINSIIELLTKSKKKLCDFFISSIPAQREFETGIYCICIYMYMYMYRNI
jgi:hypothetical protein